MPPYTPAEVAAAILAAAEREGRSIAGVEVRADDTARVWTISATVDGDRRRGLFPFASPRGIYTPAELAAHFLRGDWQFG